VTETNPVSARYLARLRDALHALEPNDRQDIVREIDHHLTDALAAGRPLDDVLRALGPADALARAYAVELALNPSRSMGRIDRALTVIGLLTVASLPSFIIVVVLGSVGVALTAAGAGVFVGGIAAIVRPDLVPDLTVSPWLCLVLGPAIVVPGIAAFVALNWHVRFLVRLTVQTVRRVRSTA